MESPTSRKRKRTRSPPSLHGAFSSPPSTETISALSVEDDDDSTDFKLALLSSLHPETEHSVLLDILLESNGDVEKASATFAPKNTAPEPSRRNGTGYQSSLTSFVSIKNDYPAKKKSLSKKGKTLHLYSPEDIAKHTPCSIVHNFLPAQVANALLRELLIESETFETVTFKLFDNVVQSSHTMCFYMSGSVEELRNQKTEYVYNGDSLADVRQLTPHMQTVAPVVQNTVQQEVQNRIQTKYPDGKKLKHQSSHPWSPNAAFVNCYNGAQESVGYHSDQLTYLGPRAVIASLSLGVAREFRVRRIVPMDSDTTKANRSIEQADLEGQISIHLPHNSLLVMHAEMQEEWKHSIAPASTIEPHPIAGNKRINITYRDYRASLHPKFTPKCKCDVPCVLRVVQRKKENSGKYFWMCHAGNVPGKEGCSFFDWATFDDDGEPVWGRCSAAKIA